MKKYSTIVVAWNAYILTLHDKSVKEAIAEARFFGYVEQPEPKWYQFWKPKACQLKIMIAD